MKTFLIACACMLACTLGFLCESQAQILESDIRSDGIFFPQFTEVERNATINTPLHGQCIYNTDADAIECYNGTEWVRADGTAMGVAAYLSSDLILNNTVDSTLVGWSELFDTKEAFDETSGTFVAPATGIYCVGVKIALRRDAANIEDGKLIIRVRKNGSTFFGVGQTTDRYSVDSSYGQDIKFNTVYQLDKGETINVSILPVTGGPTVNIKGGGMSSSTLLNIIKM